MPDAPKLRQFILRTTTGHTYDWWSRRTMPWTALGDLERFHILDSEFLAVPADPELDRTATLVAVAHIATVKEAA